MSQHWTVPAYFKVFCEYFVNGVSVNGSGRRKEQSNQTSAQTNGNEIVCGIENQDQTWNMKLKRKKEGEQI